MPVPSSLVPSPTVSRSRRRWAWGGVAGPAVFVIAVVIAGAATPGYSQSNRFLSELGETGAATAPWVNGSLVVVGLCLLGFGVALGARAGALSMVAGLGFAVMAGSPCSSGCPIAVVNAAATPSDALHNAAAIAAIAGIGFAALDVGGSSRFAPRRAYAAFSTLAGVGIALTSMLFLLAVVAAQPTAIGITERLLVAVGLVWVATTAMVLLRDRVTADAAARAGYLA